MTPFSVILNGFGSCTGLSVLFVDPLRTVGIPAHMAGTPAWNVEVEKENDSWVEYYSVEEDKWVFLKAMTKDMSLLVL